MLKFLIITSLVLYLVYKLGSLFFKAGAASQHLRNQQKNSFNPNQDQKRKSGSKPGEYIDYEEVK
ncbi:MAG TPA: hypothetical protein VFZ52_13760 [Chryseolinea sp.]